MRAIYSLVLWLLLPFVLLRLVWRARKQPEYLRHIPERFGFYDCAVETPVIWIHAVSVGETRATVSLVRGLEAQFPEHQIVLTHSTPTGRAMSEQMFGDRVTRGYLPYDYSYSVARFLRVFRPRLGILMETEIWLNLIHGSHVAGIPLLMLNARMSEKSARGYSRFSRLTAEALASMSAIAAQSEADAIRLGTLGGRNISVIGNLKFDIDPPEQLLLLGQMMRRCFGETRKIVVAASTRDGEEELLLDRYMELNVPEVLLVLVPRHPQRFSEVARLIEARQIVYLRRSELAIGDKVASKASPISRDVSIVLGDTMGELFAYYAAADLAYVGGSLLPYGGQNLIESCAVGTPVVIGPHTYNFAEATLKAVEAGAAAQVKDVAELFSRVEELFENPEALSTMAERCRSFVAKNRGATAKCIDLVRTVLRA